MFRTFFNRHLTSSAYGFNPAMESRLIFKESDPDGGTTPPDPQDPPAPDGDDGKGGDDGGDGKSKPNNSAEARITKLAAEKKAAEEEAQDLKKKLEEIETAKKEEKGAFKDLYEEKKEEAQNLTDQLNAEKEKAEALEKSIVKLVDAELGKLPDEKKEFVENLLEGKTAEKKLSLVPELVKQFGGAVGDGFGAGLPAGSGKPPAGANLDDKKAKFKELSTKGNLSPAERLEMKTLSLELSDSIAKNGTSGVIEYDPHTGLPK